MSKYRAVAPSNIALIKYMGKSDYESNVASSPSISLTLPQLNSLVTAKVSHNVDDSWQSLSEIGQQEVLALRNNGEMKTHVNVGTFKSPQLNEKSQVRFLKHWRRCKEFFGIENNFILESANNFPADCGIASSASSFAALTLLAYAVAKDLGPKKKDVPLAQLARLSREGSGSSCRSFFEPWCVWDGECIEPVELGFSHMIHAVVLVDQGKKLVSSSEAHRRVNSSLLYEHRHTRAVRRLSDFIVAMRTASKESWKAVFDNVWAEFWDMHSLFETSMPSFGYMTVESFKILAVVRNYWRDHSDGPLVTMDAGANVHLIFRSDQQSRLKEISQLLGNFTILSGTGEGREEI